MIRYRRWIIAALFILLGLEILTFAPGRLGGTRSSPRPAEKQSETKVPEGKPVSKIDTMTQVMQGVDLVESEGSKKIWELHANSAQAFKEEGQWKLSGVQVKFFGKSGTVYNVKGDSGSVHTQKKDMEISGHVVITTSDGYQISTDSVFYNHQKKILKTSDLVKLLGPRKKDEVFAISCLGLEANLDAGYMDLQNNVKCERQVPPQRIVTIHSASARIDSKQNIAHFQDQVQVDVNDIRMTGIEADFNYDPIRKNIKSLTMTGNVRVTSQAHWAVAGKAEVDFFRDEFVLTGSPRVMQDENELRGKEIRLLKGGKEVRVLKAKAKVDESDAGHLGATGIKK